MTVADKPQTRTFSPLKFILIILLAGVLLVTPLIPSSWVHRKAVSPFGGNEPPESESHADYEGGGIPLLRPPFEIVSVYADAPALTTTSMALFGWLDLADEYGQVNDWDIYDAPGVMLSYTDHDNAIDGLVRVWDNGTSYTCSTVNPDYPNQCWADVWIRIRTDYVIMAYVLQTQTDSLAERGVSYVWWNTTIGGTAGGQATAQSPPTYGLAPSRAMEIVLTDGLNITIGSPPVAFSLNYSDINYYDFEFTDAERLFVFGHTATDDDDRTFTYISEASTTVEAAVLVYGAAVQTGGGADHANSTVRIADGGAFYTLGSIDIDGSDLHESIGWFGHSVDGYGGPGIQVQVHFYALEDAGSGLNMAVAVLIWTG